MKEFGKNSDERGITVNRRAIAAVVSAIWVMFADSHRAVSRAGHTFRRLCPQADRPVSQDAASTPASHAWRAGKWKSGEKRPHEPGKPAAVTAADGKAMRRPPTADSDRPRFQQTASRTESAQSRWRARPNVARRFSAGPSGLQPAAESLRDSAVPNREAGGTAPIPSAALTRPCQKSSGNGVRRLRARLSLHNRRTRPSRFPAQSPTAPAQQ